MGSEIPIGPLLFTGGVSLVCLLTVFFSRKVYFLTLGIITLAYGVGFIFVPALAVKLESGDELKGVPMDGWTELMQQTVGVLTCFLGLVLLMHRNSSDERVGKLLLSTFTQSMLSQIVVFRLLEMKISKNVPVRGKDGKMKPATGLQIKSEMFYMWYASMAVMILISLVQYLKSPSPKPQAPARYDTQMSIHRTILGYSTLVSAVWCLVAPELYLRTFIKDEAKVRPMDDYILFGFQMLGVNLLAVVSFIRGSADFVQKEDQGKIFKCSILMSVMCMGVFGYQAFYANKLPLNVIALGVPHGVLLVNSLLAVVRASQMELDLKESKKRK